MINIVYKTVVFATYVSDSNTILVHSTLAKLLISREATCNTIQMTVANVIGNVVWGEAK